MSSTHPVTVDVRRPDRWSRVQLALRVVWFVLFGWVGVTLGSVLVLLYVGLPAFSAVALSNEPAEQFRARTAPTLVTVLRWTAAVHAYFALLTDRLPTHDPEWDVSLDVTPTGTPTIVSALLRILLGIPSALVLAIVMIVSTFAWWIAFVLVLVYRTYPRALFELQLGVLRWIARLLAYQASLVEEYPPFTLTDAAHAPGVRASGTP